MPTPDPQVHSLQKFIHVCPKNTPTAACSGTISNSKDKMANDTHQTVEGLGKPWNTHTVQQQVDPGEIKAGG